jgi:hypothetical protein
MNKPRHLICILFCVLSTTVAFAQNEKKASEEEKKEIKTGWTFGALPTITYSSDLGFQYGALTNIYYYGDGEQYPDYRHSIYAEMSRYTKGSGINRLFYDSKYLIKNMRVTFDISYLTEQANDFYGSNGYESKYNAAWQTNDDDFYRSRMFYKYDRKLFRVYGNLQGNIIPGRLRWLGGFTVYNYNIGSVDVEKLNKGQDEEDKLPTIDEMPGLYDRYVEWGILPEDEAEGGNVNYLKLGLIYDTRDIEACPMNGIWTELVLMSAPSFLSNDIAHTRLAFIHRQYFTLIKNDLSFAYRLGYQTTIDGHTPFYLQNYIMGSYQPSANTEGLGSSNSTRGILRNRVIGNGIAYGNLELRYKAIRFKFLKQNCYLGLTGFMDGGTVVEPIELDLTNVPEDMKDDYFDQEDDSLHLTLGAGLKLAMNENFVVSVDFGHPLDERDGTNRIYIGMNYAF